jgi:lantibiotic modifying enzyme
LSNLEILFACSNYLCDSELRSKVLTKINHIKNDFVLGNSDVIYGDGNRMEMLGLFMGLSGFGYTMLRFHDWENMPSILALEIKPDNKNIH